MAFPVAFVVSWLWLAILATVASAEITSEAFNLTDMDTMLQYSNSAGASENTTWSTTFNGVPLADSGVGTHVHVNTVENATVSLTFAGTMVCFQGASDGAEWALSVDGIENGARTGDLPCTKLLGFSEHTAVLTIIKGKVNITGCMVMSGMDRQGLPSLTQTSIQAASTGSDGIPKLQANPFFTPTAEGGGQWTFRSAVGMTPYPVLVSPVLRKPAGEASLLASLPANTSFVEIFGASRLNGSDYSVVFEPPSSFHNNSQILHSYRPFFDPVTQFMTPLDPTVQYNMTINMWSNPELEVDTFFFLHSVVFYTGTNGTAAASGRPSKESGGGGSTPGSPEPVATSGAHSKGLSSGAIAGIVIGVLVVVAAAIALVVFLARRRKGSTTSASATGIVGTDHRVSAPRPMAASENGSIQPLIRQQASHSEARSHGHARAAGQRLQVNTAHPRTLSVVSGPDDYMLSQSGGDDYKLSPVKDEHPPWAEKR